MKISPIPSLAIVLSLLLCLFPLSSAVVDTQKQEGTAAATDRQSQESLTSKIKHVIVLMLENRSFDHLLGFLKQQNKEIDGCLPGAQGCSNPLDPSDPTSASVTVDDNAVYVQVSPHHSIRWTSEQVYGLPKDTVPTTDDEVTMDGFIYSYADNYEGKTTPEALEEGAGIMKCFSPDHLPVMTSLAMEYGVFDGWFASVPGPTMVNRAYAGSATSNGMGTNDEVLIAKGFPQKSMYKQLRDMGRDYRVYYQDVPSILSWKDCRHKEARTKYSRYENLAADLAAGDMPEFTWVEPAYFATTKQPATDMHPDHDVSLGEAVVKEIYENLRASPIWEESVFMITFDEHGGFFDHVKPPTNVPNPDGKNATDDPFDFTRLGVRIPTVIVSPLIDKGSVFHAPPATLDENNVSSAQYDHTSILATVVHKLFEPAEGYPAPEYLTKRDAWAKTFEDVFNYEGGVRQDCLERLPEIYSHKYHFPESLPHSEGRDSLSDLQEELLGMLAGAVGDTELTHEVMDSWSEGDGKAYCEAKMKEFLAQA